MPKEIVGTIACACYENGKRFLGVAKITLPKVEYETFTVKGVALMGSFEVPASCQVKPMRTTVEFIDANSTQVTLSEMTTHLLDFRVLKGGYNPGDGKLVEGKDRYIMRVYPISTEDGDVEEAAQQGTKTEFSVSMYKVVRDGKVMRHIDPVKKIFIDNERGEDKFASARKFLGY